MNAEVQTLLNTLKVTCQALQGHVLGVADIGGKIEPVIEYADGVVITVSVGTLLGVAETHIPIAAVNKLKVFGEDKTLDVLMKDPQSLKGIIDM